MVPNGDFPRFLSFPGGLTTGLTITENLYRLSPNGTECDHNVRASESITNRSPRWVSRRAGLPEGTNVGSKSIDRSVTRLMEQMGPITPFVRITLSMCDPKPPVCGQYRITSAEASRTSFSLIRITFAMRGMYDDSSISTSVGVCGLSRCIISWSETIGCPRFCQNRAINSCPRTFADKESSTCV